MTEKKKYNELEKGMLARCFNVDISTINRWVKFSDDRLTSDRAKDSLILIRKFEEMLITSGKLNTI